MLLIQHNRPAGGRDLDGKLRWPGIVGFLWCTARNVYNFKVLEGHSDMRLLYD